MDAFSIGGLIGTVVVWPILALAAMIWVAEYLDRYFKAWCEDYVLALVSFLPLSLLLILGSLGNLAGAAGEGDILRAKVALGAVLIAALVGLAIRIAGVDEELSHHERG